MFNMKLINIYNIMFATISPITFSVFVLSKVIVSKIFTKYKNLILETPGLAINCHIITDNASTI